MKTAELKNVSKAFGEKQVLSELSLSLKDGEISCLMGASGSGKTTVMRLFLGLEQPDSGEVSGMEEKKKSVIFQEDRLCESISAVGNIRLTAPELSKESIQRELDAVGITEQSHFVPVSTLSGGMKRRVAILRALLAPWDILFADEPFVGLDENTRDTVISYFRKRTKGKTVLLITHDREDALALSSGIIELE